MTNRILQYGHPVLRKKAERVGRITPAVRRIADTLAEVLAESGGLGLAAPQIGEPVRVFVFFDTNGNLVTAIDPKLTKAEGEVIDLEGCLSLHRLYGDVPRAQRVVVKAKSLSGKPITLSGEGLAARVLQHELDHLDAVLFVDRVLPDTLHWVVGEPDESGELHREYTTLEDALKVFEMRMAGKL